MIDKEENEMYCIKKKKKIVNKRTLHDSNKLLRLDHL